ncbi:hypothetical protein [Planococcus koreensis]|uniref:hypothetical protein n=1 Tax=Planococcus koreensis TaxID=112331 RepID=UPI0039FD3615
MSEANLYEKYVGIIKGHLSGKQAGELSERAGARELWLTHLPQYGDPVGAETDEEAAVLGTSSKMFYLNVIRGTKNPLQPPVETMDGRWTFPEENMVRGMAQYTFSGSKETIARQLAPFIEELQIDELMAVSYIYDQDKRKRSFEILKEAVDQL